MSKLVVFGTGQYCRNRLHCFDDEKIIAFSDNNPGVVGENINGVPIVAAKEILNLDFDYIVIMTGASYSDEIYFQLIKLGINQEKIFHSDREYFASRKLKNNVILSSNDIFDNKTIICIPNLYHTGGIRAAIYLMKVLLKIYGQILVVSPCTGIEKEEIQNIGADILITSDISRNNSFLWKCFERSERIILNGLYYSYLIPEIQNLSDKKILWWLHTGNSFYKTYPLPANYAESKNIKVMGVSTLVSEAYKSHCPNGTINLLPFGVPDDSVISHHVANNKMIFATIGVVSRVKGQDIFVEAIRKIPPEKRTKAEFWIIGGELNAGFSDYIHEMARGIDEIKWFGSLPHDEVMKMFENIDVLVSASREDMLPIVNIESMLNSIPCIITDSVGTASYIENNIDGFIVPTEDSTTLSNKMIYCIDNPEKVKQAGKKARKKYEKYFSMNAFEDRVKEIFENEKQE